MNSRIKKLLLDYTPSFVKIIYRLIRSFAHKIIFCIKEFFCGITIPHMGIFVTSVCNLNCRECADLVPYRMPMSYDIEEAVSDLSRILSSVYEIDEVLIIGGETFLYKDLDKLLSWCLDQKKIKKVMITTNGTVMPSEKTLNIMASSPKAVLRISGYPKNVAPRRQEIVDAVIQKGIRCENLENMQWKDIGDNIKRNHSITELKEIFRICGMKFCVTLIKGGDVVWCSRQLAALLTDDYPSPLPDEYLNVRKLGTDELKKAWKRFYRIKYISTCDYCDGLNAFSGDVETARQILPKKEYIRMLRILFSLHDSEQAEHHSNSLRDLRAIIETYDDKLAYLTESKNLIRALDDYNYSSQGISMNVYMLCVMLAARLYKDYRVLYVKRGGYGEKNLILVSSSSTSSSSSSTSSSLLSPENNSPESSTMSKADLYVSPEDKKVLDEIARLGHWEYYHENA